MGGVSQSIDRLGVFFDDEGLVADAGLLVAGTLMDRLGLEGWWIGWCGWGSGGWS